MFPVLKGVTTLMLNHLLDRALERFIPFVPARSNVVTAIVYELSKAVGTKPSPRPTKAKAKKRRARK